MDLQKKWRRYWSLLAAFEGISNVEILFLMGKSCPGLLLIENKKLKLKPSSQKKPALLKPRRAEYVEGVLLGGCTFTRILARFLDAANHVQVDKLSHEVDLSLS